MNDATQERQQDDVEVALKLTKSTMLNELLTLAVQYSRPNFARAMIREGATNKDEALVLCAQYEHWNTMMALLGEGAGILDAGAATFAAAAFAAAAGCDYMKDYLLRFRLRPP